MTPSSFDKNARRLFGGNSLLLATLVTSHLLTSCVATSLTSDNDGRQALIDSEKSLLDAVKSRAEEKGIPVIATAAVADSALYGRYKTFAELEWAAMGGWEVAHFASDDLESIRELGEKNQTILIANMRLEARPAGGVPRADKTIEVGLSRASFLGVANILSDLCRVSVYSDNKFRRVRFTVHSGGGIPIPEGCRFFAWIFAANGIAIESKEGAEYSIVFVDGLLHGEN